MVYEDLVHSKYWIETGNSTFSDTNDLKNGIIYQSNAVFPDYNEIQITDPLLASVNNLIVWRDRPFD